MRRTTFSMVHKCDRRQTAHHAIRKMGIAIGEIRLIKIKFHYADFVADTNHESPRHKSCRRLSCFVSRTFVIFVCVCRGLFYKLSPCKWHGLNSIRATQTDPRLSRFMSATFSETSWFHDLSPFVFAIFVTCVPHFPRREVLVKVGVMEFGLKAACAVVRSNDCNEILLPRKFVAR